MNEQIEKLNDNTWCIYEHMVRCFLLAGREKALLVDTGMTIRGIRAIAEELCGLPVELLNTHGDPDHVGANAEFERAYLHPEEEPNYRRSGVKGEIIPVQEGDTIDLGGRVLEIIHLPGHTLGSIGLLDREAKVLISGDAVQTGGIVMLGKNRSIARFAESLHKLETVYAGSFDTVWGAHGQFPLPVSIVTELRESAEHVLAGEGEKAPADFIGHPVQRIRWGKGTFLVE